MTIFFASTALDDSERIVWYVILGLGLVVVLVVIALMLLLLGGWLVLPGFGSMGTLLVLAILAFPGLLAGLVDGVRKPADLPWSMHLRGAAESGARHMGQALLALSVLPYDAFVSLDAISRTLLRLFVTRRRLLEWQTSLESERTSSAGVGGYYSKN